MLLWNSDEADAEGIYEGILYEDIDNHEKKKVGANSSTVEEPKTVNQVINLSQLKPTSSENLNSVDMIEPVEYEETYY